MPGRPCITPGHPLTNRERVARHRAARPKPKPPPHQEGPFVLRTFGEVAASLLPEPPKPPERKFDPEAIGVPRAAAWAASAKLWAHKPARRWRRLEACGSNLR